MNGPAAKHSSIRRSTPNPTHSFAAAPTHIDIIPASPLLARYDLSDQDEWERADLRLSLVDAVNEFRTSYDYIVFVCRPRSGKDIGDWRAVLSELPKRMHEWMPRLANEGVVGADAILACIGPAPEIFSRYSRVEKANGDPVLPKEYLEHVWVAVSKEAISTIFRDADASALEPDARLTALGATSLDRLHQSMILFGAQRGELLKRFLVEDGVGKDARFWTLAQSLAALDLAGTDERRWVEGDLARKKGLGL